MAAQLNSKHVEEVCPKLTYLPLKETMGQESWSGLIGSWSEIQGNTGSKVLGS